MANPLAYFNYNANGLNVTFLNLSQNVTGSTTFGWTFGDGNTSTSQSPTHTYAGVGFFDVELTLTDGLEVSTTKVRVGVNVAGKPSLGNFNLIQLISNNLPTGVTLDTTLATSYIRTWQDYLFPLVDPPSLELDKYNETCYDPLVNQLIGKLSTVDLILQGSKSYLLSLGNLSGASKKDLKKVVTGPAESEWFSGSDTWYDIMKSGGALDTLKQECCMLADRIDIYLPFCQVKTNVIVPQVSCPTKTVSINKFPFS